MYFRRIATLATLALLLSACGQQAEENTNNTSVAALCDRDCIIEITDYYLSAIVAGKPSAAPLAKDIVFVENLTRKQPGEGLWQASASAPTQFAIYIPDTDQQQAGFMGVMTREVEEGLETVLLAVRLKIEEREIVEAEHLIAGVNENNMQHLLTPRAGLISEIPEGQRQSHEDLVTIGLSYYDALDDNDGSLMPFADDCQRHENGMIAAGAEAGPGPNFDPDRAPVAKLCAPQLDSQSFTYIEHIENRRLIAADPVTGLAIGFSHFRHSFENLPYDVIHTDGSITQRNSDNMPYDPFDMPAAHIFKVGADGLVHEIEALGFTAPYNSPTGWE